MGEGSTSPFRVSPLKERCFVVVCNVQNCGGRFTGPEFSLQALPKGRSRLTESGRQQRRMNSCLTSCPCVAALF